MQHSHREHYILDSRAPSPAKQESRERDSQKVFARSVTRFILLPLLVLERMSYSKESILAATSEEPPDPPNKARSIVERSGCLSSHSLSSKCRGLFRRTVHEVVNKHGSSDYVGKRCTRCPCLHDTIWSSYLAAYWREHEQS
jgi:hypothetical protein